MSADPKTKKHAVLLSDSIIETDPRVRKFAQTLIDAHWQVTTLGLPLTRQTDEARPWTALHVKTCETGAEKAGQEGQPIPRLAHWLSYMAKIVHPFSKTGADLCRKAAASSQRGKNVWERVQHYCWLGLGLRVFPQRYQQVYWASDDRYALFLETATAEINSADMWIANDWNMVPVALALSEKKGGKVLYDSHEYAVEQFVGNTEWRWFKQPLVKAVERDCIGKADAVSSVSPGLCAALQSRYGLAKKPTCIRNIPHYQKFEFRPCGEKITILYQGVIGPGRALEEIIRSTPYWRDDFRLIIRGPVGQSGYDNRLRRIIDETKPAIDIRIEPPVPFDAMITRAHEADIGILALPGRSIHNRCALPNKVFEYMMAGLALCVSDHEDMAELVRTHGTGTLITDLSAQGIAKAINAIDRKVINVYKRASLQTARELSWEKECKIFQQLWTSMLDDQ